MKSKDMTQWQIHEPQHNDTEQNDVSEIPEYTSTRTVRKRKVVQNNGKKDRSNFEFQNDIPTTNR